MDLGSLFIVLAVAISPPASLTPTGQAIVDKVTAAYAKIDLKQSALPPPTTTAERLARMVEVDQVGRVAWINQSDAIGQLAPEERRAVLMKIGGTMNSRDAENVRVLKTLIPADGWFRKSRDGDQVTKDAWLIVQHATDDPVFMQQVLVKMEWLAKQGEVRGSEYALLYDRVSLAHGKPQRYGSQMTCKDGHYALIQPVEDFAHIDARRHEIGLPESEAEYQAQFLKEGC